MKCLLFLFVYVYFLGNYNQWPKSVNWVKNMDLNLKVIFSVPKKITNLLQIYEKNQKFEGRQYKYFRKKYLYFPS